MYRKISGISISRTKLRLFANFVVIVRKKLKKMSGKIIN